MSGLTHSLNKGGNIRCWLTLWNHKVKNTMNNITLTNSHWKTEEEKKDKAHSQYILLQSASTVFIHKLFRLVWLANVIFSFPEMGDSSACFFSFRDDFRFRWKRIVPTKLIYNDRVVIKTSIKRLVQIVWGIMIKTFSFLPNKIVIFTY